MRLSPILFLTFCLTAKAVEPIFSPMGISINGRFAGQSFEFEPVGYKGGTTVNIHLTTQDLIVIDSEASTITGFTDNLGKDLLNPRDGMEPAKFGPFPKVNVSGTAALFDVSSPQLPGKAAQYVTLNGNLVVKTATAKGETINKHVKLVKGAKLVWGSKALVVDGVRMEGSLSLSVKTEDDVGDIAEFSLIDTTGKKSVGIRRMNSMIEISGKRLYTVVYEIESTGDTFDVAIGFWKDLKTVEIPFAVKIGLGL